MLLQLLTIYCHEHQILTSFILFKDSASWTQSPLCVIFLTSSAVVFSVRTIHTNAILRLIRKSLTRQKGGDLTQSYDKSPYTNGIVKRAKWQHKQRHNKDDSQQAEVRLPKIHLWDQQQGSVCPSTGETARCNFWHWSTLDAIISVYNVRHYA